MSTYVLVADSGTARLFRSPTTEVETRLEEVLTLVSPSAHVASHDMTSDRGGRIFASAVRSGPGVPGTRRGGADSDYDPHEADIQRFAKRIVRRLDEKRREGEMDHLCIVADPKFLGVLRGKLSRPTQRLVDTEIAHDMTHAKPEDIVNLVVRHRH